MLPVAGVSARPERTSDMWNDIARRLLAGRDAQLLDLDTDARAPCATTPR